MSIIEKAADYINIGSFWQIMNVIWIAYMTKFMSCILKRGRSSSMKNVEGCRVK